MEERSGQSTSPRTRTDCSRTRRVAGRKWRAAGRFWFRAGTARRGLRGGTMNTTEDKDVQAQEPATPKRDYRQEVTNQIVEMLEKGTAPWQKPWEAGDTALPFNPTSERGYRGGNALHLMAT